jgi:hypothetical protein
MAKIIRLTESDLNRIIRKVINESFQVEGFDYVGEKTMNDNSKVEVYGKQHRGFKVLVMTGIKNHNGEDVRVVKVMVYLPGGEFIDVGQEEMGKSWIKVSDPNDIKLKDLIDSAENLGRFRTNWDNTPKM